MGTNTCLDQSAIYTTPTYTFCTGRYLYSSRSFAYFHVVTVVTNDSQNNITLTAACRSIYSPICWNCGQSNFVTHINTQTHARARNFNNSGNICSQYFHENYANISKITCWQRDVYCYNDNSIVVWESCR